MEARCHIELFGELCAVQGDERITRFRTQKAASLLAYLALNLHQTHAREQLIDIFWPEMTLEAGRDNLSTTLSSLRRQLEPAGIPAGSLLLTTRQHVRLNPELVSTDVRQLEILLRSLTTAPSSEARLSLLERSATLCRGELLPGFYEDWAVQAQSRWSERQVDILQQWGELLEQTGRYEEALAVVQRAVAVNRFREEGWQAVMRLYARMERSADALEAFATFAHLLQSELGIAPAAATGRLADQIKAGRRAWDRDGKAAETPPARPSLPEKNLRNAPAKSVAEAAKETNRENKSENSEGQTETALPAAPAAADLQQASLERLPDSEPAKTLSPAALPLFLTRFFGREAEITRLLEIVHNVLAEPGSDVCCRLITLLGPGGAGKTRLANEVAGRLAAQVQGRVWFVSLADLPDPQLIPFALTNALKLPAASHGDPLERVVETLGNTPCLLVLDNFEHLLREPHREQQSDKRRAGGGSALVRILLERIPSLICLVTSRIPLHLSGEQEFPLTALELPEISDVPERLRQCESVALYTDRARTVKPDFALTASNAEAVATLCRRLEGMPLAIEMAAAWAKLLPPARMLERLEHRLDILVSRRRDLPARHQSLRATIEWSYDLLSPEVQIAFARLSVLQGWWTLETAEALLGADPPAGAAEERFLSGNAVRPLSALDCLAQLQEHSLLQIAETEEETRCRMLDTLRAFAAEKLAEAGETDRIRQVHAVFFADMAHEAEQRRYLPEEKEWLDRLERDHDNLLAALTWLRDHDIRRGLEMGVALSRFWELRGYLQLGREQLEALLKDSAACQTLVRAAALNRSGLLAFLMTDYALARMRHNEALELCREQEDRAGEAMALHGLGNVTTFERSYGEARPFFEASLAIRQELDDPRAIASSHHSLGNVEAREENYAQARLHLEKAISIRRELGDRLALAYSLGALGQMYRSLDEYAPAIPLFREVLETFQEMGVPWSVVLCLNDFAAIAEAQGALERAATISGAALTLREACHYPVPPGELPSHHARWEEMRRALGDAVFTAAWNRGRAMNMQEAVAFVLKA